MLYRPLLRWKRGEQTAATNLSTTNKEAVLPVITLSGHAYNPLPGLTTDPAFDARIVQDAERLKVAWTGYRASVDFNTIDPEAVCQGSVPPVRVFFDILNGEVDARPVLRFDSDQSLVDAVADLDAPPTFRLTPDDLAEPSISSVIQGQLDVCGVSPSDCDLVIDMGYIATTGRSTITAQGALSAMPFLEDWESVTLAAGSFPENLSQHAVGIHTIRRIEWDVWSAARADSEIEVLYGDYTTIHPIPVEDGLDPRTMNPSASARYTRGGNWLLLRGEGTRNPGGPGFSQFLNHADTIFARPEYRGEPFSFGDGKIARIHRRQDSAGNLETWVTIGVNHHIAEIVDQLANLP